MRLVKALNALKKHIDEGEGVELPEDKRLLGEYQLYYDPDECEGGMFHVDISIYARDPKNPGLNHGLLPKNHHLFAPSLEQIAEEILNWVKKEEKGAEK